ncbi:hypothetical protein NMG60_11019260 [Bertholletia excelsa]
MEEYILDYILVPAGLSIMVAYHMWLIYQVMKHPSRTVIGVNAVNRRLWVSAMMEDMAKNGVLAVQTLRNNIMASTMMASTAIMLSSLIALLMTNGGSGNSSANEIVYGDRSRLGSSIKFFSILVCFLVSFLLNVQSIRYHSHAGVLINVPYHKLILHDSDDHCQNGRKLMAAFVARTMNKGSYFWSLGLRAFYFSFPLFMWIFGPIPMALSSLILVFLLYFLDTSFDFVRVVNASATESPINGEEETNSSECNMDLT